MKIKIINPDFGMTDEELRARENMIAAVSRPDTVLSMDCLRDTQVTIDSAKDIALASAEIVRMAIKAESEGYDAVVLYCMSDPAITACREVVKIPVVGGGQASIAVACTLGYSFSMIIPSGKRIPEKREFIRATGVDLSRLASIRSVDICYSEIFSEPEKTISALVDSAKLCVQQDHAEVIVLGCLSFAGMAKKVSDALGVPVVDPAFTAVAMAELLVSQGLGHSKISYPFPPNRCV
ncbi:MAG: aspartate/glutamate racemase family protein [Clostridiales bacterium]|jgi:allantoin racemase|nr:aspartate/glutamate racemase family protein [Eubacteriales bacterium]MDH7566042.1 aspartate/glutamate racemase family protein [Clostridiales bacterium]